MLDKWLNKPAEWWQFWFPQSGIKGGLILGGLIVIIISLLEALFDGPLIMFLFPVTIGILLLVVAIVILNRSY